MLGSYTWAGFLSLLQKYLPLYLQVLLSLKKWVQLRAGSQLPCAFYQVAGTRSESRRSQCPRAAIESTVIQVRIKYCCLVHVW